MTDYIIIEWLILQKYLQDFLKRDFFGKFNIEIDRSFLVSTELQIYQMRENGFRVFVCVTESVGVLKKHRTCVCVREREIDRKKYWATERVDDREVDEDCLRESERERERERDWAAE